MPAGSCQHLGEILEGGGLHGESVGHRGHGDRLPRQGLGLGVAAAVGVDASLYLSPERLGRDVVLLTELPAELRLGLRLVEASGGTERAPV